MLLGLINLISSNFSRNSRCWASFPDEIVRYKALANGANRPTNIRTRNIALPLSGSPRCGAANQHTQVTKKVSVKKRIGL